jgi:hypothetical protein
MKSDILIKLYRFSNFKWKSIKQVAEKHLQHKVYFLYECNNVKINNFQLLFHNGKLHVSNGVSSLIFEVVYRPRKHKIILRMGKLYDRTHYRELLNFVRLHIVEIHTKRAKIIEQHSSPLYIIHTDTLAFQDDQYLFRYAPMYTIDYNTH